MAMRADGSSEAASRTDGARQDGPWYVVRLKPGGLDRACSNLSRQGVCWFSPERLRTTRRSGRLVTARRPLFPGYLFIAVPPGSVSWRSINATYGVASVVCLEPGRPSRIPTELISALRAATDAGDAGAEAGPRFAPGEDIRVVVGPFADLMARVEAAPEADRILVLLDMMGRTVRTTLNSADVERAG